MSLQVFSVLYNFAYFGIVKIIIVHIYILL